jgi:predicted aldo/keto reductase-like oxidoreductase
MIRFCLSNPYNSTIDAGARYPAEFKTDVEASLLPPMTAAEREALKAEADKVSGLLDGICRECMHCLEKFECPQGISFPDILGIHARYSISKALEKELASFRTQYAALTGPKADICAACGACSPCANTIWIFRPDGGRARGSGIAAGDRLFLKEQTAYAKSTDYGRLRGHRKTDRRRVRQKGRARGHQL